ncbi:MAG: helix-turn-helix transcriptional regulator [Muribaculaceae bacterium]
MAHDLLNRYIWLIDTIRRYGRITRRELNTCWERSPISNGEKLARRTLYNYRLAIADLFGIEILCDPTTFEYYLEYEDDHNKSVTDWLLNATTTNDVLSGARDVSDRIFIEDVPSARGCLRLAIDALRGNHALRFSYYAYSRALPRQGISLEPLFLKLFRQRWYVTGVNAIDGKVKTYALDRMREVTISPTTFAPHDDFDIEEYTRYAFGIVFTPGTIYTVKLRADVQQAKYLRDLPLHPSQQEVVHDSYSIFSYQLRLTPDLVTEILSHGPRLTVLEPPELKAMVMNELSAAIDNYHRLK